MAAMAGTYRAQGRGSAFVAAAVAVAFLMCAQWTAATDHPVDGTGTWTFSSTLQTWSDGQKFVAGDRIIFDYTLARHTVITLNEADWTSCTITNPITSETVPNTTVILSAGTTYFTCGIPAHCPQMKFSAVVAAASASPPTSPTPAPPPGTATPPTRAPPPTNTTHAPASPPSAAGSVKATLATVFGAAALALVL
eukprot:TRINITY_DN73_c0_g1_i1.p1 TRINITY_DN73_c0_g1~~TRINITY_DN73_c0_g1_i1.p1  ORF type:complete len:195 (+),score=18.26 TRINITY_DN73_c0_g1_i1:233-817(+)